MLLTKCVYKSYLIYMYKPDVALNNLQWLICHKTKLNQSVDYNVLWSRGGWNDNTTQKWVIKNILKENSAYINDSWEKPLYSLTGMWTLYPFLVMARRDCAEESLVGMCHTRASPSVGETPQRNDTPKSIRYWK